ncbi:hypothetical protein M0Q97_07730 [Candidatus Dojkabacteria bacterium]|jgi:hypothetical protein|nr:hypothetical protein [Candidatus Dojkabacteria bacterium]
MKTFKDYFKFPLVYDDGLVFTSDYGRAFDFPLHYLYPNAVNLTEESQQKIVELLNNPTIKFEPKTHLNLRFDEDNAIIYQDDKEFIIIRGWGHLTGCGALNLDGQTATKIQNEFAYYIVETLNKY